jgi:hypothetical protein
MWLYGRPSTGAKTLDAIERILRAVTKHGRYSKRAKAEWEQYRKLLRQCRETLAMFYGAFQITFLSLSNRMSEAADVLWVSPVAIVCKPTRPRLAEKPSLSSTVTSSGRIKA